jgi:hypothetical protein
VIKIGKERVKLVANVQSVKRDHTKKSCRKVGGMQINKLAKYFMLYYQIGTSFGTMVRDHHLHLYLPPATGVHPKKQKHKLLGPPNAG